MAKRACGALFLVCAAVLLWLFLAETAPRREPVYLAPEAVSGPPGLEDLVLYAGPLELDYVLPTLPEEPEEPEGLRPTLEIRTLSVPAELLLDGAPLCRIPAGLGWAYLTLPGDCAGRTLTLRMEKGAEDTVPTLYLTDSAILREQVRADTSLHAFPAAAFALVFLLTLGLFLYGLLEGTRPWPLLPLSAAALGQAGYFYLLNLPLDGLPPALYGLALWQSRALLYAAPPLCLLLHMKKRRRAFAPFALLPALVYWAAAGFQTVVPALSGPARYAGLGFWAAAAALLACAALEARDGNPVFRRFLSWLGACAAVIGGLCLASVLRTGTLPVTLGMYLRDPLLWLESELFCWNSLLLALCLLESGAAQIRRMARRDAELQVLSARESLIRSQLAAVQESAAALGELRHEVKNHYLVLQNLAGAGEGERLEAYLAQLVSEAQAIPPLAWAPHPAINAVLTAMLARARREGVRVERRISVPDTLPFPDTELCTVLMNLLQNALDANALAPEGARKWLRVDLHIRGVHLFIGVENARFAPVDYDPDTGLCRTTKDDPSAHGYGLRAVQAVARKYKSELLLDFPDGAFSAATALQMPE